MGKSGSQFGFRSSTAVGEYARCARSAEHIPWANRKTHFGLGSERQNPSSDYFMRFQQTKENPNASNGFDHMKNKAKCDSDSVQLGVPNACIKSNTV